MIRVKKGKLSKKEEKIIRGILSELVDKYSDFYITKNNLRLFIRENLDVIFSDLEKGDYIAFDDNGVVITTGFADNAKRKYIKLLTKNISSAYNLLFNLFEKTSCTLYVKLKKNNPLIETCKSLGFVFFGGRGKELLLIRRTKNDRKRSR
ncbi:hypothetical protein DRJ17_06115 [Candidatus Woesearchaeota archaeon]|nr:MAG: hypothetical protein DRJ17_06115 [Candidatus Woesearchaeota archaeon]